MQLASQVTQPRVRWKEVALGPGRALQASHMSPGQLARVLGLVSHRQHW